MKNSKKAVNRPVVKFRALDDKALEAVKSRLRGGEAEDSCESEEESESDEAGEEGNDAPALPTVTLCSATTFEINPLVDIAASALLDMISEKPVRGGHVERPNAVIRENRIWVIADK